LFDEYEVVWVGIVEYDMLQMVIGRWRRGRSTGSVEEDSGAVLYVNFNN
jgi:hypothetical protein